ncbi:MAG TPA: hypothetical protein VGN28_00165 [Blastococcus sp.]|nr:hypothetical protein [Blastococcus sp.]
MLPTARPVGRRPPAAAIAAAVLGLLSCAIPALLLLIVLALAEPDGLEHVAWFDFALPLVLIVGLVTGAVLLLLGRAWLPLAVVAGLVVVLVVVGRALGGLGGGSFLLLGGMVSPLLAAALSALPGVRGWVAERKAERSD